MKQDSGTFRFASLKGHFDSRVERGRNWEEKSEVVSVTQ